MTTQPVERAGRRPAVIGFLVGFIGAFVFTIAALLFGLFETLEPVLVPGAAVLSPWSDTFADWNGLVTMLLVGLVNGLIYAVVFAVGAAALRAVRRS